MKLSQITNSVTGLTSNNSLLGSIGINSNLSQNNNDKSRSFSNILKASVEEVNDNQVIAYDAMNDIATGKVENLQEAVKKIEEAELSLKLGLEVKNKALSAYKQIMAMQV